MREALENPANADQAPRLTAEQARAATQAAAVGDDPSASTYARHLLARHHTIAELETLHGTGAVDPDKLLHVVNQMRQFAANSGYTAEPAEERAHIERAADTAAAELAAATALDRLATRPADDAPFRLDQTHEHDHAQEAGL